MPGTVPPALVMLAFEVRNVRRRPVVVGELRH